MLIPEFEKKTDLQWPTNAQKLFENNQKHDRGVEAEGKGGRWWGRVGQFELGIG